MSEKAEREFVNLDPHRHSGMKQGCSYGRLVVHNRMVRNNAGSLIGQFWVESRLAQAQARQLCLQEGSGMNASTDLEFPM